MISCETFCFIFCSLLTPCSFLHPHASQMFWDASHFCAINHVLVPLSLPYASHRSRIGSLMMRACHVVQSCMERLYSTLKLHGSPMGCSRQWTRIGFPWQLETAFGRILVLWAGNRPVGPSSGLANSLGLSVPWVESACACIGESHLIPSVCKIKGGSCVLQFLF